MAWSYIGPLHFARRELTILFLEEGPASACPLDNEGSRKRKHDGCVGRLDVLERSAFKNSSGTAYVSYPSSFSCSHSTANILIVTIRPLVFLIEPLALIVGCFYQPSSSASLLASTYAVLTRPKSDDRNILSFARTGSLT